jgi:DNA-binding GntR family transcriptional regulator
VPPVPLSYREVADDLAARIERGEYEPGAAIPSYRELADLYTISVSTASRAVALLRDRGLVVGAPGRGVFVAERGPNDRRSTA